MTAISGGIAALGWGALRLFGLLRMQVLWRSALGPVWEGVSAALALLLASVLLTRPGESVALGSWIVIGLCEFLLGSVIGGLISLPGAALLGAAQQSAASLQLPRGRGLPVLLAIACVSGGLLADLHRPLLVALRELLVLWPVGEPGRWSPGMAVLPPWILASAHTGLVLALTFATPVLLTTATLDLGLRLTARGVAVPLLEVLRPWLVAAAALIALGAAWAAYPGAWLRAWPMLR
jgi:type III secretory pathway component EscT